MFRKTSLSQCGAELHDIFSNLKLRSCEKLKVIQCTCYKSIFFFWLNRLPSFTCTTSSSTHPTDWIDVHRIIIEIRLQLVCVRDDTATLWRGKINVYSHGRRMFNLLRENDEFNNLCAKVEYLWAFPSSLYTHMCDVQLNYHRTIQFIYPWGDFSSIFFFAINSRSARASSNHKSHIIINYDIN